MPELPPNVHAERRTDAGTRKLFEEIKRLQDHQDKQRELLKEELTAKLEGHVSYKVLIGSIITVAVAIVAGVLTLTSSTRSQVEDTKRSNEAKIEKVDLSLQQFKAETGAEVKGIYRFLLEKQSASVVKTLVEQEKRDNAPPPAPINPMKPSRGQR